jgi:hypothetical protein
MTNRLNEQKSTSPESPGRIFDRGSTVSVERKDGKDGLQSAGISVRLSPTRHEREALAGRALLTDSATCWLLRLGLLFQRLRQLAQIFFLLLTLVQR